MKNLLTLLSFLFLSILTNASNTILTTEIHPIEINTPLTFITLQAGTIVSVHTNEEIDASDMQVGNTIDFFVRSDVRVNGQVVIATGAIAEGWVKKVSTSCDGNCSKITITVENVQTVDGQRIYLRSIPHTVKIDCCNGSEKSAIIPLGTKVSARVLNNVDIDA